MLVAGENNSCQNRGARPSRRHEATVGPVLPEQDCRGGPSTSGIRTFSLVAHPAVGDPDAGDPAPLARSAGRRKKSGQEGWLPFPGGDGFVLGAVCDCLKGAGILEDALHAGVAATSDVCAKVSVPDSSSVLGNAGQREDNPQSALGVIRRALWWSRHFH